MKYVALVSIIILSSCTAASNYYENLKHTSSLRHFVSDEEKLERYKSVCRSLSITEKSDNWENCLLEAKKIDENAASERGAANRAAAQEATERTQPEVPNVL